MKRSILLISKILGLLILGAVLFTSCEKDDDSDLPKPEVEEGSKGPYENGIFITNEGGFQKNNGSVSFYCTKEDTAFNMQADKVYNKIFEKVNGVKLGDVVQSLKIHADSIAYILVNNSNKVVIVDRYTFKQIGVVEGISGPRYMESSESKGFVSCWGDNSVKVLDLNTNTISKSIPVGAGPEKMVITNNKLYVANTGGYGTDSTISVIDIESEEVVANIPVKYSPRDIEVDNDGNIWALCYGKIVYDPVTYAIVEETPSMVYKIDSANNSVLLEVKLFDTQHPTSLDIDQDGSTLYFGGGFGFVGIYSLDVNGTTANATKIVADDAYGFEYNTDTDALFALIAPDFAGAGELIRYSTDGTKLGTYSVGIGPNGAAFKRAK